ncbi:hypothetical protein EOL94_03035 [bacterium]|nr:hypothetical protein [bacterium]
MFKSKKKFLIFVIIFFSLFFFFTNFQPVSALDVGLSEVNNEIDLGSGDPRSIAARVINIALAFLGLIAVVLIIYAGFLWMTANGEEQKVESAKKVLRNAIIGLIIILASWGIATFVLNRLVSATNPGINEPCVNGEVNGVCGCGGTWTCVDESWQCLGSNCGGDNPSVSCDGNPLTPSCEKDNDICASNYFCNDECFCQEAGNIGDPCDSDLTNGEGICDPDNTMCSGYLECNSDSCTCDGSPVITSISPFGGFCDNNINQPCEDDDDCVGGGACSLTTPNGSENSFISIHGQAFDEFTKVYFTGSSGEIDIEANNPSDINGDCSDTNTNNLIIVAVPNEAVTGPIKVVDGDGKEDVTDNDFGPGIEDFVVNNISRPGLCNLNPDEGNNLDTLNYYGNLLNTGKAYFGNYDSNVLAYNNVFNTALNGSAQIPNVQSGDISTFVKKDLGGVNISSNIFDFTKLPEEETGPYINSFSPASGPSSQYVTIYGGGFGNSRGNNMVSFGNIEANYNFPEVCADTVWSDNKIIVKVPDSITDGVYTIKINIDSWEVETQNLFTVSQSEELAPSLCRIQPQRGPVNSQVTLYGEYFGSTGDQGAVIFSSSPPDNISEDSYVIESNGDSQLMVATVSNSPKAISGPVKVKNNSNNKIGNSLDFIVGECTTNNECSPDVCCPEGSTYSGRCVVSGEDGDIYGNCFSDIHSSVFQWSFTTMWGVNGDYDSCLGMAQNMGACQDEEFCPNSPGQCSPYAGGEERVVGYCQEDCSSILGCGNNGENCEYEQGLDRCQHVAQTCSLGTSFEYVLGEQTFNTIKTCNENNKWQIQTQTSCPDEWTNMGEGICVDENSSCNLCSSEFSCIDDNDEDDDGICVSERQCPNNSYCNNNDECVYIDSSSCDCCCRKDNNNQDCCTPLICDYTCGSDEDGDVLGVCSGCYMEGASVEVMDDACNCSGTSGKFCETTNDDYPTGVCVDCTALLESSCLDHTSTCCWDSEQDSCVGGDGTVLDGKCAYYNCDVANPSQCAINNPQPIGDYRGEDECVEACANSVNCGVIDNSIGCISTSGCCWDQPSNSCVGGSQIASGSNVGSCDYYDCDYNLGVCNNESNPLISGAFSNWQSCEDNCSAGEQPEGAGESCTDEQEYTCDTNICGNPFSCINNSGILGSDGDCGYCCCDPSPSGEDTCKNLSDNLICLADKGSCSGDERGLCCGCTSDSECGNESVLGCGIDTCCYARPEIEEKNVSPSNLSEDICRNVVIEVPFKQKMKINSLSSNFLLLQELGANQTCPSGTIMLVKNENNNWWNKTKNQFTRLFKPVLNIFNRNNGLADVNNVEPNSGRTYCSVLGSVSKNFSDDGNTILQFSPNKVLSPDARYYGIVLGDEDLNSQSGVLSQEGIGLNGKGFFKNNSSYIEGENYTFNGKTFSNSYIWTFKTLSDQDDNSGICVVDYVRLRPESYLFQKTTDDLNENDVNENDNTYDTIFDNDKAYSVGAYSENNQKLKPINSYKWLWDWKINNIEVAQFEKNGSVVGNNLTGIIDDKYLISVTEGIQKGETTVKVTIDMDDNNIINEGDGLSHTVPLYVFACNNPWPAPDTDTHAWEPWEDSSNPYADYNYTFYYCRDAGSENTYDDLPALISDGKIIGPSKICSVTGDYCENNSDCLTNNDCESNRCSITGEYCDDDNLCSGDYSGNECVDGVLKEYYFFREELPGAVSINKVEDTGHGGEIRLGWTSNEPAEGSNFKIYYKRSQDSEFQYLLISPNGICDGMNNNKSYCEKVIENLDNDTMYYFSISLVESSNIESVLSNQVSGRASDSTKPGQPTGIQVIR